jgi:general secretion pathway protein I
MHSKQKGFTLIEVMIALVIVVVSVVALMKSTSQTAGNTQYFIDKTLASIVLGNLVVETRILGAPSVGYKDEKYQMAGRDWYYRIQTTSKNILLLETIETTSKIFIYKNLAAQQEKDYIAHATISFFKNNIASENTSDESK